MEGSRPQKFRLAAGYAAILIAALFSVTVHAGVIGPSDKLTNDEKIALLRDLSSEYAKAKIILPRSGKPLEYNADGTYDQKKWQEAQLKFGPVARLGDEVQITKVTFDGDKLLLEINGGMKTGKGGWRDHVSIGMGTPRPINNSNAAATTGTTIELNFHKPMESLTSDDVKKILGPLLEFNKRSAAKLYAETLTPEMQKAVFEKRALEGMSRDEVILALGHPDHKYRESKDGVDTEDWIFGKPPGKITFVTFEGSKVVKVKEQYAGLGIQTAAPHSTP